MKLKLVFSFLLVIIPGYLAYGTSPAGVTGKVTDALTHQPIAGATISVSALKITAISDQNGLFSFNSVPSRGKFIVEVRYVGYTSIMRSIDFSASEPLEFELQPSLIEMQAVVITGSAISSNDKQNSTSVSAFNREQLLAPSTNIIDAISRQVPGMSQITTGPSISKPVIRGLGYTRVVTLSDGIKQQGQQWGDEHGIEIDQFGVDRVEVLRGAASLLYGSDALGGVVNMLEPLTAPAGTTKGEFLTNYSTNNRLSGSSLMLTGNESGYVWRARASYKTASSFKTPEKYFPNSGFNEANVSGMLGLNKQWGYSHFNLSYFKNNIGFYEPVLNSSGNFINEDGDEFTRAELKSHKLKFPRQDIRHYKLGWDNNLILGGGYLKANLGFQKNQRRELDGTDPALYFDLNTYSTDIKYYPAEKNGWQAVLGTSADAGRSENRGSEFLVPDYKTFGFGVFVYLKKTWTKNTFNIGARYDYRNNKGKELTDAGTTIFTAFTNDFSNVSAALGYTHEFNKQLNFKANAGTAFRSPSIPELASNGVHEGTFRYEIGSSGLLPERSYQEDATLEFNKKSISGSIGIYTNYIHNYIYAANRNNEAINVTDDNGNTVSYPVYRYTQVNATLSGIEGSLTLHLGSVIHFENSFGYTHAQNMTFNRPLAFIPAASLRNTLRLEPEIKGTQESFFSIGIENFSKQTRVDDTFETPADGYSLVNAGMGTTLLMGKHSLKLSVSANNLMNLKYYDALSRYKPGRLDQTDPTFGVYNPGRNLTFGVYVPF